MRDEYNKNINKMAVEIKDLEEVSLGPRPHFISAVICRSQARGRRSWSGL